MQGRESCHALIKANMKQTQREVSAQWRHLFLQNEVICRYKKSSISKVEFVEYDAVVGGGG